MSRFRIAPTLTLLFCALFMAVAQPVYADDLQEINKLYKQGQNDKALERLDSFLTSRPKDAQGPKIAQGRFLKGLILTELGKSTEAIKVFTQLTEEYPELPEPYNNLAVLYASQGQYDKARHALEMAISTHPSYATAHENLGDIYAKMASQAYDKALQLDKSSATAQTKLAMVKELFSANSKANRAPNPSSVEPAKPAPTTPTPAPAKPETAKPTPETKPAPETKPIPVSADQNKSDTQSEVLKTLHGWAKAWSGKNVGAYLSYYAKDFKTPGGESRSSWEKSRKERISKPKSIHVDIDSPRVNLIDANHASITFRQGYKSAALSTSTQKTVVLVKTGDKWLIQQERVGR
ncbi:MAG: tetratricopeptide repeat protein [Betaproteobacteria bacterium]|nr:tetratricopeptide repeat protein [Betaproteobacteria bacterium]